MSDHVSADRRSRIMKAVGVKDTAPEMAVRQMLHAIGYRFRLHRKDLPGKPDIVFPGRRKIVLVHGCFWHGHGCRWGRLPKSRLEYWGPKIAANVARDARRNLELERLGWDVRVVWQCELREPESLQARLIEFLGIVPKKGGQIAPKSLS